MNCMQHLQDVNRAKLVSGIRRILYCTLLVIGAGLVTSCETSVVPPAENPSPKKGFTVLATTEGLPAGSEVSALAHYYVKDERYIAVDYTKALGGSRIGTVRQEALRVAISGNNKFSVEAFDDFYLPSTLSTGRRPCEFSLVAVSFDFSVDGLSRGTSISREELDANEVKSAECGFGNRRLIADACIVRPDASAGAFTFAVTTKKI